MKDPQEDEKHGKAVKILQVLHTPVLQDFTFFPQISLVFRHVILHFAIGRSHIEWNPLVWYINCGLGKERTIGTSETGHMYPLLRRSQGYIQQLVRTVTLRKGRVEGIQ